MRKMRKVFAAFMAVLMTVSAFNISALAEEETKAEVYVTIADENGELALSQEKITVTDIDNDGALTINDALYAAHEAKYEGGAAAGYASSVGQYGLAIDKLWGTANGGSYGYWVNNQSAWSLADTVKEGDYINAFVYTDLTAWSDTYCFFDEYTVTGTTGDELEILLSMYVYDENYNKVLTPVEGADITVNGKDTDVKTDAEGKASIKIKEGGSYVISATSDSMILVPPVCTATIATNETAKVYVTISDKDGSLALSQEEILVSDTDKDGSLTINDALYAAHEAKYEGGAATGYSSYYSEYGLSLSKLWGTENGGSYGYWVNNQSAWSLADTVKEGDYINAFVYTDLTAWSDTYCFFDTYTATGTAGKEITLVLSKYVYDADWNRVLTPVEGAVITVNGKATEVKTNAEGKATINIDKAGEYLISAVSDAETLVPPVCKIAVSAETTEELQNPPTGDSVNMYVSVVAFAALFAGIAVLCMNNKGKKVYEK